jgi:protein-tyrosine phosphatase
MVVGLFGLDRGPARPATSPHSEQTMIPLVDTHCHLLAGLDDGPRTDDEALDMCRLAYAEGTRLASATAHQNERWPSVTPDRIRHAASRLARRLRDAGIPLTIFPCAEIMVFPEVEVSWRNGDLLSVADRRQYLLLEMPHGLFVDLRATVTSLRQAGVRPILAHPERHAELLHEPGPIEQLIRAGCLVQVSSGSVTDPPNRQDGRALKGWLKRGVVHLLGSDGHSPSRRPPRMADAYRQIVRWADRVCSTNGLAILQGLPLRIPEPEPRRARWVPKLW